MMLFGPIAFATRILDDFEKSRNQIKETTRESDAEIRDTAKCLAQTKLTESR